MTKLKRNSKKPAPPRSKKPTEMTDNSSSTVSLSSAPGAHRISYRWRYLQLIKDGLIWLTGKRTRGIRMSQSDTSNASTSSASAAKKGKKPVKKQLCFKVGLLRGKSKKAAAKNKKCGGPKPSYSQRKGFARDGRKGWKGRPNRTSRSKSKSNFAGLKRNPKSSRSKTRGRGRPLTGCGPSKRLASSRPRPKLTRGGRPRTKAAIGGGRLGRTARGVAVPKRGPPRVASRRGMAAAHRRDVRRDAGPRSHSGARGSGSRKPRSGGMVTRSVSRLALNKRTQHVSRPTSPVRELPKPILLN